MKYFNVHKLNDVEVAQAFEQNIGGRFEPLLNCNLDIDELYNDFKNITNQITQQIVGFRKRKAVEGMSKETAELCKKRREARKNMLADPSDLKKEAYKKLNKEAKNSVRKAKK